MAYIPKILSRPFQGAAAVGNALWNGDWNVPRWAFGAATENEEDLKSLDAKPARVNQKAVARIKKAYKTLGLDYEQATSDPDYIEKASKQVMGKMKAAGVDIADDASITAIAAAYDKMSDAQKKTYAEYDGSTKPQETAPATARQLVSNGQPKASAASPATDATPIAPRRQQVPTQTDVTTGSRYNMLSASDTGVRANGAPVDARDTATRSAIKEAQRESATTDALQARRIRQGVQNDMRSDGRRLEQEHMANQDALDANLKARSDRLRAEREAARKERMDKRYESRTLTGMSDWENLGRDSTKRSFGAREEGESDESWNARSGAVDAVEKLRKRFSALGVKDADKNEFYAYNPKRMRDVSGLGNLFNKAVESGNLTDAQIEGINKTLDTYEGEGRKTKATLRRNAAMRDAENVRKYREMYGMGDRDVFSDDDVKKFHADRQYALRKEILQNMQVAPALGDEEGRSQRIRDFSDSWMKLIDNGLDVTGTFKKAMSNEANRKAYQEGIAGIAADDPERADKMDQLRRRFVMNQAMSTHGIKYIGGQDGAPGGQITTHDIIRDETGKMIGTMDSGKSLGQAMADSLPGKDVLANGRDGNAVTDTWDREVAKAEAAAAVPRASLEPLEPKQPPSSVSETDKAKIASGVKALLAKSKSKELQQAWGGGMVLRPRRRTS